MADPPSTIEISNGKIDKILDKNEIKLNDLIDRALPPNYNFEIPKTIRRLLEKNAKIVALQMPEGLLSWSCEIALILKHYANLDEVVIMSDVTYGACCIDDLSAISVDCDFIVHYGHSCLIPVYKLSIPVLYVFVEIVFNYNHFADTLIANFDSNDKLYIMGTIQYISNVHRIIGDDRIKKHFKGGISFPQAKPLMPGEVLGCTCPNLGLGADNSLDMKVVFLSDGRFHLESAMIHNPHVKFFRYDPFVKTITHERYDFDRLHCSRLEAIEQARAANLICIILSTLGRQGNTNIYSQIEDILISRGKKVIKMLLSEIMPSKLSQLKSVDIFVQVGCPRLSIDWGTGFTKPLLNPYEFYVAFGNIEYKSVYPMDYYAAVGGEWNNHSANVKAGELPSGIDKLKRLGKPKSLEIRIEN